jgi:hypothetical protein
MSQRAFGDALADRQIIRCGKDPRGNVLRMGARLRPKGDDRGARMGAGAGGGFGRRASSASGSIPGDGYGPEDGH